MSERYQHYRNPPLVLAHGGITACRFLLAPARHLAPIHPLPAARLAHPCCPTHGTIYVLSEPRFPRTPLCMLARAASSLWSPVCLTLDRLNAHASRCMTQSPFALQSEPLGGPEPQTGTALGSFYLWSVYTTRHGLSRVNMSPEGPRVPASCCRRRERIGSERRLHREVV